MPRGAPEFPLVKLLQLAIRRWLLAAVCFAAMAQFAMPAHAETTTCTGGELVKQGLRVGATLAVVGLGPADSQPDLIVSGPCTAGPDSRFFGNVNIIAGGSLTFKEGPASEAAEKKKVYFWAKSIIIEDRGAMRAGVGDDKPYGTNGFQLNIVLYGSDLSKGNPLVNKGAGAPCVTPPWDEATDPKHEKPERADCGIPKTAVWDTNGSKDIALPGAPMKGLFYKYGTMYGDSADKLAHFGYKVLGLSYGGTLELRGAKGTSGGVKVDTNAARAAADSTYRPPGWTPEYGKGETGTSWVRLAQDLKKDAKSLTVDRPVEGDWQKDDKIVVTTTDYLPNHSEELTITKVTGSTIDVAETIQYPHNGHRYDVAAKLAGGGEVLRKAGMDPELMKSAETRAAVALLTRSIRIVSGGDIAGETFELATKKNPNYSFGGHTVFRQGFRKLQLQGVEFRQLGQGGKLAHYPVHFHMARQVPADTYIKDSSVNESMTRWYVIHSTLGVTLQRNVGWKSIGHGYYLEDGTETDNKFYANIGIWARAAVVNPIENPRNIPGILADNSSPNQGADPRYRSDVRYPAVFWITNAWNEFVGNMAVGAGTCGACYWLLAAENTDMMESGGMSHMKWSGYSGRQGIPGEQGTTPLKIFYRNYCSTAMHSLDTTTEISTCLGVHRPNEPADQGRMEPVPSIGPKADVDHPQQDMYYPHVYGSRAPTVCDPTKPDTAPGGCGPVTKKCSNDAPTTCATYVIDHYTSSFNWAETNFSAIWLRNPGWFLMDNSFISDVQNGGLTFVSGGDYSKSSSPTGYWALVSRSIFVGQTQPDNPYAWAKGPNKPDNGGLTCSLVAANKALFDNVCLDKAATVAYPLTAWATNQRLFNIYDGPAYQDGNAYLDIPVSDCNKAADCMYFGKFGVRRYPNQSAGYLPNAAIGWKQPNGFYYPPAFHSQNLFFKNVDIRHYVVSPLLERGTYRTDEKRVSDEFFGYLLGQKNIFSGYTDIDRQTELNDDDGTLTGFVNTVSVNEDPFFGARIQAPECRSNKGIEPAVACAGSSKPNQPPPSARTSPYDYVTTVIYPECATSSHYNDQFTMCGSTGKDIFVQAGDGKPGARFKEKQFRGGTWSKECTGPFCTGVPIYRQYLTGEKGADKDGNPTTATTREWLTWLRPDKLKPAINCDKFEVASKPDSGCDFPFARMSGANFWQRDIMTVNNGKYYIDTTRSRDGQRKTEALGKLDDYFADYDECEFKKADGNCEPRSVSVFQEEQTYYVFFLFAKATTKQIYQFYVGDNFIPDKMVKGVLLTDRSNSFGVDTKSWEKAAAAWNPHLVAGADGKQDILQVEVDFSKLAPVNGKSIELDPKKATGETCKPASFCSASGNTCGCSAEAKNSPLAKLNPKFSTMCDQTCKTWAVKDLDCPEVGCLGFSFTLPKGFKANDQYKRPKPEEFPPITDATKGWSAVFKRPAATITGDCTYSNTNTPGEGDCKVPD